MSSKQQNMKQTVVLQPGGAQLNYWRDLLRYHGLFWVLAKRDVLVRYKQTAIGVLWAVLRPLITMAIFSFVFGRVAQLPSNGIPYPLLVFAGMVPWLFFSSSVAESSLSLVSNANLLSKVYFPRMLIPASSLLVAAVDFLISMALLLALMVWCGVWPTWRILTIPIFLLIAFGAALGLGLFLATMSVRYRDFQFVVPFLLQIGLYASPVGFYSEVVPEQWRLLFSLNPMVGVIDGFRWALLGSSFHLEGASLAVSASVAGACLWFGVIFFKRHERAIADVI